MLNEEWRLRALSVCRAAIKETAAEAVRGLELGDHDVIEILAFTYADLLAETLMATPECDLDGILSLVKDIRTEKLKAEYEQQANH